MNQSPKNRQEEEREHYNAFAIHWQRQFSKKKWLSDVHLVQHNLYESYKYLELLIKKYSAGQIVLDYGCGTGIHSICPIQYGAIRVVGIDISDESLKIAKKHAQIANAEEKVHFKIMDCENLEFPDNSFDIILDGGTFSSLNLEKALAELARVLKPDGKIIGIETLGHNPIFNLKRRLNVLLGTRTRWAADHIFKLSDFTIMRRYFNKIDARFFHLTALSVMPFIKIPGARFALKATDKLDSALLKIPFLKKYAFKTVFIASQPKK